MWIMKMRLTDFEWMVELYVLILATVPFQFYTDAVQDIPWSCYENSGSCYYLPDFRLSHSEASCWCRSVEGHLVKIDSAAELTLLRTLVSDAGRLEGFHIGATDEKHENHYVWEDGSSDTSHIPWHDWGWASEPDNHANSEHCAVLTNKMWWEASPTLFADYDAMDVGCHMELYFVCEKNKGSFPSREWVGVSRDQIYPSSELKSYSGFSLLKCADHCAKVCGCLSFGYNNASGSCILYDKYYSRLTSPQNSPGYVHFN